jgi:hypothetical protein
VPCVVQVETEGDVATAFTLARILSNIPPSRGGPTSIVIFDIHALQVGAHFLAHWLASWLVVLAAQLAAAAPAAAVQVGHGEAGWLLGGGCLLVYLPSTDVVAALCWGQQQFVLVPGWQCHTTVVLSLTSACRRCCLQERFYFGDGVLPLFESGIPLLLERLKQLPDKDKVRRHCTTGCGVRCASRLCVIAAESITAARATTAWVEAFFRVLIWHSSPGAVALLQRVNSCWPLCCCCCCCCWAPGDDCVPR